MNYFSTRGAILGGFSDILLQGLAPDGGLAMPEIIKRFKKEEILSWRNLSYPELAEKIIAPYCDIEISALRKLLQETYNQEKFNSTEITPLSKLDENLFLLELSNGPSLAFKDVALQLLGQLFAYVLQQRGQFLNILGATSGDTGSAAEYAVLGKNNINIFMLSPHQRMSAFQQAQMFSLQDKNIFNIAIKGVFDDCQDLVKNVNADAEFKEKYRLGAVNSINWARILAQSVYYFAAYLQQDNEEINVVVPSGNFGNIFAGYLAKCMGLPIKRFVVASNENNVLTEFFNTGIYRPRLSSEVYETSSPSMDIGKASNFERFLYLLSANDSNLIRKLWRELDEKGQFDLRGSALWEAVQQSNFSAYASNHQQRLTEIRNIYQQYQRVIDPHTADGIAAWRALYPQETFIVLETALPAKFSATVKEALGFEPPRPERFTNLEALPQKLTVLENSTEELKNFIKQHLSDV